MCRGQVCRLNRVVGCQVVVTDGLKLHVGGLCLACVSNMISQLESHQTKMKLMDARMTETEVEGSCKLQEFQGETTTWEEDRTVDVV